MPTHSSDAALDVMKLRSLLFVPGDQVSRMHKALASPADALILDLEDSVAVDRKAMARGAVADFLQSQDIKTKLFVRINPIDGNDGAADLAAVVGPNLAGVVLPKSEGAHSVEQVGRLLSDLEGARGLEIGSVRVLPIATETPAAIFGLGSYGAVHRRLAGLTWGAEDLPAAIGALSSREADGRFTAPYELVRALALFGACAAGVQAIETVYPPIRDLDGLAAYVARARRDGFTGMMAIHPAQVPVINDGFTPTAQEIAFARAIVDAFAERADAGALAIDGKMVDRPHLIQAKKLLARADLGDACE